MANKVQMIWAMYGILIDLKEDYDLVEREETFEQYSQKKLDMLKRQWMEWIADDERDSQEQAREEQEG